MAKLGFPAFILRARENRRILEATESVVPIRYWSRALQMRTALMFKQVKVASKTKEFYFWHSRIRSCGRSAEILDSRSKPRRFSIGPRSALRCEMLSLIFSDWDCHSSSTVSWLLENRQSGKSNQFRSKSLQTRTVQWTGRFNRKTG